MRKCDIPTAIYYKRPMHQQKAFEEYRFSALDYKTTERICDCCLSLPIHPYLNVDNTQYIASIII